MVQEPPCRGDAGFWFVGKGVCSDEVRFCRECAELCRKRWNFVVKPEVFAVNAGGGTSFEIRCSVFVVSVVRFVVRALNFVVRRCNFVVRPEVFAVKAGGGPSFEVKRSVFVVSALNLS
jgi:hypothetical protein